MSKKLKQHVPIDPKTAWEFETLMKESDRGRILVGGAMVEEVLADLVAARLQDAETAHEMLGDFGAPCGTFSAMIALAFALGLLTKLERQELDRFRDIRNAAAHLERHNRGFGVCFDSVATQHKVGSFAISLDVRREPLSP